MAKNKIMQDLESKLTIRDGGAIAAEIGLMTTMYFRGTSIPAKRQAIAACFDIYRNVAGDNLRWVAHPKNGKFRSIREAVPSPSEWLQGLAPNKEWAFQYRGGTNAEAPNLFSVETLGPEEYGRQELGYFKATFPMLYFAERADSFVELVLKFCRLLQPEQGYGGLGILESPFPIIRAKHEPIIYQLAQRFPGLEVDYPASHSLWLDQENGIKGVNWLTILGDHWVKAIGGIAGLKSQLNDNFLFEEYAGGVLIKSGARPQMGDLEQDNVPAEYVRLNALLKPIRIKRHRMFQHPGSDRFDQTASEAWLARYDRFAPRW